MQGLTSLSMRLDPVRLAQSAGIQLDPWQQEVVRSRSDKLLLNASRQSGKSLVAAILGLHTAMYQPGSLVCLISVSLRQSTELFRQMMGVWAALGKPLPADAETLLRLELSNTSRVLSLPGTQKTLRGLSNVALVIADEAARIPDELFLSVLPFLAVSQGRLLLSSTPWGSRGHYYTCYRDRAALGFEYWEVPATKCPRIDPAWLSAQERLMGRYFFESEYLCKFLQPEGAVFSAEDIAALASEEAPAWTFNARPHSPMRAMV